MNNENLANECLYKELTEPMTTDLNNWLSDVKKEEDERKS